MALETASYINGLVTTNPAGSDPVAQADDHIRLIKTVIKNTFPNVTGAVTATQTDLNNALPKSGGTMTGTLTLNTSTPTNALEAASKGYVDTKVAASTSGLTDPGSAGMVARTTTGVTVARTISGGSGITVTNGNGQSGNPTVALSGGVVNTFNGSSGAVTGVATIDSTAPTSGNINLSALTAFLKNITGTNGYFTLPGGTIVQFGKITGTGAQTINFATSPNIAFPTACYALIATHTATVGNSPTSNSPTVTALSASSATLYIGGSATGCYWVAIGN